MRFMNIPFPFFRERITLHITSDVDEYNIYTEAGSPGRAVEVIVIVDSGVVVGSTGSSNASMATGSGWSNGSTILIINNGDIIGAGGDGGHGGSNNNSTITAGGDGGTALDIQIDTFIDNTNGNVYGGGGGGGGGGAIGSSGCSFCVSGGGGGGGAGSNGGAGGARGSGCGGYSINPANGTAGSTVGGSGGTGGTHDGVGGKAGSGGNGGDYATAGSSGTAAEDTPVLCTVYSSQSGGAAGKAVELNGNSILWRGGNNSSQVKGAVS